MAKTTRQKFIELAQSQVGYAETGTNQTKYAHWFDHEAWQWFNTKKQGAEWCSIFICWCLCQNDVGIGKEQARTLLGCPKPADNCAAGVPYLWDYLGKKGYRVDNKGGAIGDIIIFNNKTHVGMIEKIDSSKYYTIEGNKGNKVSRCTYSKTNSAITGIFHLPLEKFDKVEDKPVSTPELTNEKINSIARDVINGKYGNGTARAEKLNSLGYGNIYPIIQAEVNKILTTSSNKPIQNQPAPAPTPTPTPYKVTAIGGLWLRKSPPINPNDTNGNHAGQKVLCMSFGGTFYEESRNGAWSYGTYNNSKGWACNTYLVKK